MLVQQSSSHVNLATISTEISDLATWVEAKEEAPLNRAVQSISSASRVFSHAAGRSGIALQMFAMRVAHLGVETHVVGSATTPSIGKRDVLVTASGSGTTRSVVETARKARENGAQVIAFTGSAENPLAVLANEVVVIPAAVKTDHSGHRSRQYAGSLFEQLLVVLGDALFTALWRQSGQSAEELWLRHANLE